MINEQWNVWSSCHEEPDQQKRIASAKKAPCTPTFVDMCNQTGTFKGSSGNHTTSLEKCSCIDFNRRRKPCKHMYRLAMELDIFQDDFVSDLSSVKEPTGSRFSIEDTVHQIESFTYDQQNLLLEILRNYSSKKPIICLPKSDDLQVLIDSGILLCVYHPEIILPKYLKNDLTSMAHSFGLQVDSKMKKADLISYILENASDKLSSFDFKFEVLSVNDRIKYGKVHMYLHRKFDNEVFFDVNMNAILTKPMLETRLPDDDVTSLLRSYGYYKL